MERYHYRPEVRAHLLELGFAPTPHTPPERVYELVKSLYTFEIREMKHRRREMERVLGPQPLEDYRRGLWRLRQRYTLLEMPAVAWLEDPPS